ncbi:hypothetical protein MPER_10261, partial [Moniliophthora perniciosa FA553]
MSSTIPEVLMTFLSVRRVILVPLFTLVVMYLVYGFYILLFGTYIYMMRNGNRGDERANHNLYLTLTVVLFVLTTLFVVDYTVQEFLQGPHYRTPQHHGKLHAYTSLLSNVELPETDWSATYRDISYHKRDSSSDSNWALYVVGNNLAAAYDIGSVIVNSALTLLTAGRIWWMHRQVRAHGAHTSDAFVSTVFRIILESGALYPTSMIAALVVQNTPSLFDLASLVALSAGIAPTLIMSAAALWGDCNEISRPDAFNGGSSRCGFYTEAGSDEQ